MKVVEEIGGKWGGRERKAPNGGSPSNGCVLASCTLWNAESPLFPFLFSLKRNTIMFFDIGCALSKTAC